MSPMTATCPECGKPMSHEAKCCRACRYPNARSDDRSITDMNSDERARYGCTCTFENADGKRLVIHRPGSPRKGLREACEAALTLDPTFLLVAYSTPYTIYQDMQGARMGESRASTEISGSTRSTMPEATVLATAGLSHLLHPRLAA